ncbi:MAG: 2-isopropylmalate synthase [Candidatus Micrarchaeota archaeon]|nr:2-isopropylmalate synthase [Candidatus Micrarchaeota archaeon]
MRRIRVFDTTLRDGEQSPGCSMRPGEKIAVAKQLEAMRVDVIEAGFPAASKGDSEAVEAVARETRRPVVAGLARCAKKDVDECWRAVRDARRPRIHVFLATSPIHMKYKLKKTPAEVVETAAEFVRYAAGFCNDVEFSPEDATRTEPRFLYRVLEKVIDAGATTVNIPDTVGYAVPGEFGKLVKNIGENVSNIGNAAISVHCHDDLGMAVANSLAGVENGATQVECTVNGIGERAGNAALEEIAMAVWVRKAHFRACTGIRVGEIYESSRLVSACTGLAVQRNKAVVGENAFAHEAGIHQHGILCNPRTYEVIAPEKLGRTRELVIGKHSGRHAVEAELRKAGYRFDGAELEAVVEGVKAAADCGKTITAEGLFSIVEKARAAAKVL